MPTSPWTHAARSGEADDIDFEIKGQELQFVEIELDPGESAVAEAGAMVWKDASVAMATVFGDGRGAEDRWGGGSFGRADCSIVSQGELNPWTRRGARWCSRSPCPWKSAISSLNSASIIHF